MHRRNLLLELVRRDFQQRYAGSAAGWLWGLAQPVVLLASWTFVFRFCLKTKLPDNEMTSNYTLYLLCGYLPWMLFQETVMRSTTSLVDNANLITKTVFPAEILPVSVFLSALVQHSFALVLTIAAVAIWDSHLHPLVMLLPFYIVLLAAMSIGASWITAALQVYLRDTVQVVNIFLTFWFWMTPIMIAEQDVPARLQFVVRWNPLSYMVRCYRERLLGENWPRLDDLAILVAASLLVFCAGWFFFRHVKRGFADVL